MEDKILSRNHLKLRRTMDKKTKNIMFIIAFGIVMYAAAMNLGAVLAFAGKLVSLLLPLIIGLVLAFVLSVPMGGFEKLLRRLTARAKLRKSKYLSLNQLPSH